MSATTRYLLLVTPLLLACSGCTIPTLKNPLVNPSDAKAVPNLHGVYRTTDGPDNIIHYEHVGPAGADYPDGFLRMIFVSQPKDSKTALDSATYVGFVEPIGKYHVLHIPLPKTLDLNSKRTIWDQKWDATQVSGYLVLRLSILPDGIEVADLNEAFVAEAITGKQIAGVVTQDQAKPNGIVEVRPRSIAITADAKELQPFFTRNIDRGLFNTPYWKFTRVK